MSTLTVSVYSNCRTFIQQNVSKVSISKEFLCLRRILKSVNLLITQTFFPSVEKELQIVADLGAISGLKLSRRKTYESYVVLVLKRCLLTSLELPFDYV